MTLHHPMQKYAGLQNVLARDFLHQKNILANKQFGFRITKQSKAFFIFKEEFLSALCNEVHVAAISRNLAIAFHCLNNESQKGITIQLDNSLHHIIMTEPNVEINPSDIAYRVCSAPGLNTLVFLTYLYLGTKTTSV